MENGKKHKSAEGIFEESRCLSREVLKEYLEDTLTPEKRQAAEKHLIDCELCSDALEGYMEADLSETFVVLDSILHDINIIAVGAGAEINFNIRAHAGAQDSPGLNNLSARAGQLIKPVHKRKGFIIFPRPVVGNGPGD